MADELGKTMNGLLERLCTLLLRRRYGLGPSRHEKRRQEAHSPQMDEVAERVAEIVEQDAQRTRQRADAVGSPDLRREAKAMEEIAENIRAGDEGSLLAAMGVLGRREDSR